MGGLPAHRITATADLRRANDHDDGQRIATPAPCPAKAHHYSLLVHVSGAMEARGHEESLRHPHRRGPPRHVCSGNTRRDWHARGYKVATFYWCVFVFFCVPFVRLNAGAYSQLWVSVYRSLEDRLFRLHHSPQHPAAHGVLRMILELNGEEILRADPVRSRA